LKQHICRRITRGQAPGVAPESACPLPQSGSHSAQAPWRFSAPRPYL